MKLLIRVVPLMLSGMVLADESPSSQEPPNAKESPPIVEVITGEELQEPAKNPPPRRKVVPKEKISLDEAVDMPRDI